jgi:hypothetical protein
MTWPHVARSYEALFRELVPSEPIELVSSA